MQSNLADYLMTLVQRCRCQLWSSRALWPDRASDVSLHSLHSSNFINSPPEMVKSGVICLSSATALHRQHIDTNHQRFQFLSGTTCSVNQHAGTLSLWFDPQRIHVHWSWDSTFSSSCTDLLVSRESCLEHLELSSRCWTMHSWKCQGLLAACLAAICYGTREQEGKQILKIRLFYVTSPL